MKAKIKKDKLENIALMSVPAVGMAVISLPFAVLAAIGFGLMLGIDSDDEITLDISFIQWLKIIESQHLEEEKQKAMASLYWQNEYRRNHSQDQ